MNHKHKTLNLKGSCHCGSVQLILPSVPDNATSCNCSLCRRTGGIWAYFTLGTVSIQGHPEHTESYVWGDRTLLNFRCKSCGILTHWEPIESLPDSRHGINLRNFDPDLLEHVTVRKFDGADTWEYFE